jgi:hypothetical protein
VLRPFFKETLVKGQPASTECVTIDYQTYSVTRGLLTTVSLEEEWYEDVRDPEAVIASLQEQAGIRADLFTFWQRFPDIEPRFAFHQEWDDIAVLPARFDEWWNHRIKSRTRNLIRKSEKEGVVVKETSYDDEFVHGMTTIFNEVPVRQGRRFWHFGKDFETVKTQFSRYVYRERMIGAYYQGEMIGLVMLGNAGRYGVTGQIISSIKHRDKATNNALIAKAIEVCEKAGLQYLIYLSWTDDSLGEFKRRCGFDRIRVPRYYVPLSAKGRLGLKMGAHRGVTAMLPDGLRTRLKKLRSSWYQSHET